MSRTESTWTWPFRRTKHASVVAFRRYQQLHLFGKVFIWGFILLNISIASIFIAIGPAQIAQKLYDFAHALAEYPFGWLILGAVMVITCFPPLIGYSTAVTLCGFAYGVKGFFIAAPAALLGSAVVFVTLRYFFKHKTNGWSSRYEKWNALETVIKRKGLPLIILMRLCPMPPWVYANACFASLESVALWQFVLATICVLPKIFLTVFIGSRAAALADGEQRGHMDASLKVLNAVSIVVSIAIAVATGVVVYRLVQRQIREFRESGDVSEELAAEALEEAEEGAPLLGEFLTSSRLEEDDEDSNKR